MNYDSEEKVDMLLKASDWYANVATRLITEYRNARTQKAKAKLIPKLEHIKSKLAFNRKEIDLIIGEGEEWNDEA